jgi:hypothetical protein
MREFMVLVGELVLIGMMQVVVNAVLEEGGKKTAAKVINIACIFICYFLLARYVYNNFIGELSVIVNTYF